MVETLERTEKVDKIIHTTYELAGSKKSSWVKEGTGPGTNVPAKNLHHAKTMFVPVISRVYLGKGKGYRDTAWVIGADTHYVEDYYLDTKGNLVLDHVADKAEAEKKKYTWHAGLKTQKYDVVNTVDRWSAEYRRSMEKGLCFEDGRLELSKYGDSPVLRKFIEEHEQNKFAPRSEENKDPSRLKLFMFQPLIRENKAAKAKVVASFDDMLDAMNFVSKLRTKTATGYTYDETAMDAVLGILQDGVGIPAGGVNEKFEVIARASRTDGQTFMSIINSVTEGYRMDIAAGELTDVLTYNNSEALLTEEGKKRSIHTFKNGTEKASMVDELTQYFLGTPKGKQDYAEMKRHTELAKLRSLKD